MINKEVIIKVIGVGISEHYQALIEIYDKNEIIYKGITYDGVIKICLEKNKAYNIRIIFRNNLLNTSFIVDSNCLYTFVLPNNIDTITFLLTDYYYPNLPIMKGELILWQK